MKHVFTVLMFLTFFNFAYCQSRNDTLVNNKYYRLIKGSNNSNLYRVELFSDIDTTWNKWKLREYNYGFDPGFTPMHTTINGIISTPYMIQVRGNENELNKKRWGYHVFEGYAKDNKSRITLLVNKHFEKEKPVAAMYYYGAEYGYSELAYNWFRIGSDIKQHSFLFSRDKAIFYGSLKLTNALTLGQIGKDNIRKEKPGVDNENYFGENAMYVNYKELKESENGTIFYDKDNNIVVIKVNEKWMKLLVEPLPDSVKYDFE